MSDRPFLLQAQDAAIEVLKTLPSDDNTYQQGKYVALNLFGGLGSTAEEKEIRLQIGYGFWRVQQVVATWQRGDAAFIAAVGAMGMGAQSIVTRYVDQPETQLPESAPDSAKIAQLLFRYVVETCQALDAGKDEALYFAEKGATMLSLFHNIQQVMLRPDVAAGNRVRRGAHNGDMMANASDELDPIEVKEVWHRIRPTIESDRQAYIQTAKHFGLEGKDDTLCKRIRRTLEKFEKYSG